MAITSCQGERTTTTAMLTTWYDVSMSSALLRCFPVCCSLPPSMAPKAEAVVLDLAPPVMNGGGLGGGGLNPAAVRHIRRIFAGRSSPRELRGGRGDYRRRSTNVNVSYRDTAFPSEPRG
jgi:hypothetical protein